MILTNKCNSELEQNIVVNRGQSARFEVLVVVLMSPVSWDMMLCCWVSSSQHFEGPQCLQNVWKHSPNYTAETQSSESTLLEGVRSSVDVILFGTPFLCQSWNVPDRSKKWSFLLVIFYVHTILCSGVFLGGVIQQWWTRWCAAAQRWLHCQCTWAQLPVRKETINTFFKYCCFFITSVLVRSKSTYWPGLQCHFFETGFWIYEVWKVRGFKLNMG